MTIHIATGNPEQIWEYVEPDENINPVFVRRTEEEIVDFLYERWSSKMKEIGKEHLITELNCVDDYIVVHWAYKIE